MGNPICHWEVCGSSGLKEFFGQVFDWEFQPAFPGYEMVSHGPEHQIGGGIGVAEKPEEAGVFIYFFVDDLEGTLAKATAAGGTVIRERTPIPGHGFFALFTDPDGHVIGIFTGE